MKNSLSPVKSIYCVNNSRICWGHLVLYICPKYIDFLSPYCQYLFYISLEWGFDHVDCSRPVHSSPNSRPCYHLSKQRRIVWRLAAGPGTRDTGHGQYGDLHFTYFRGSSLKQFGKESIGINMMRCKWFILHNLYIPTLFGMFIRYDVKNFIVGLITCLFLLNLLSS